MFFKEANLVEKRKEFKVRGKIEDTGEAKTLAGKLRS